MFKFSFAAILPLIALAAAATSHRDVDSGPSPALLIVKDHGFYIMSSGATNNPGPVYAQGCNPNTDADFADNTDAAGGDDFVESLPLKEALRMQTAGVTDLLIKFTRSQMVISVTMPTKSAQAKPKRPGRQARV